MESTDRSHGKRVGTCGMLGRSLSFLILLLSLSACARLGNVRQVVDVPLSGGDRRFDYQSLDPGAHRLFVSHMDANLMTVFDTETDRVVRDVEGLDVVTGVLVVPSLGRVYASVTGTHEVAVIDEQSLKVLARVPAGNFPDGLAFDPVTQKLYVSDEQGSDETVIDTRTNRRVATVPIGGEAGNTQYDPISHLVYVNEQSTDELVAIDPLTDRVVERHRLPGASTNHGLYIDAPNRLAFVACEGNARLLVYDLDGKRVIGTDSLGLGPDVLAFDPGRGLLYVACESGVVSVFREQGRTLRKVAQGFVGWNAHSVAVDPLTHRLYFPLLDVRGPVLRVMDSLDSESACGAWRSGHRPQMRVRGDVDFDGRVDEFLVDGEPRR